MHRIGKYFQYPMVNYNQKNTKRNIHTHTHIYVCIYICVYVYVCIYMYVCVCVCVYTCMTESLRCIIEIQFSCSVVSNSFWPHGLHFIRPPWLSPTPGVYSDSCPLSQWCHPAISSSVIPFSSCLQSFPASGPFQVSQFFTSGGQSIRVSASASVLQWIFRTDFL